MLWGEVEGDAGKIGNGPRPVLAAHSLPWSSAAILKVPGAIKGHRQG